MVREAEFGSGGSMSAKGSAGDVGKGEQKRNRLKKFRAPVVGRVAKIMGISNNR